MSRARLSPGVGRLLVVLAAAAGVLAAACGAPSANYQRDPSGHLVFALPTQWTVFSQTELYRNSNPDASYVAARNATSASNTPASANAVENCVPFTSASPSFGPRASGDSPADGMPASDTAGSTTGTDWKMK